MKRANHKLSFKYFGPYEIVEKIGTVAYRLQLPSSSAIHLVFRVSLLKKVIGDKHQVSEVLPDFSVNMQIPVKLLQRRFQQRGDISGSQVLVQWSHWPPSMSTWEDIPGLFE